MHQQNTIMNGTMNGTINEAAVPEKELKKVDALPKHAPKDPVKKKDNVDMFTEILERRDGKDKTLKIMQYTGKLVLRFQTSPALKPLYQKYQVVPTLDPFVKQLSLFRKVIKLGEWLKGFKAFRDSASKPWDAMEWVDFLDGFNGLADDLELLSKIGTINKRYEHRAALIANYLWFIAIIIGLRKKLAAKDRSGVWRIEVAKLVCDLIFCVLDTLNLPWVDPVFLIAPGLSSAILAYMKIWYKVR